MIGPTTSDYAADQAIYAAAAEMLGWTFQPAYNGYVRGDHLKPGRNGSSFDDFPSDVDAEEACDLDGLHDVNAALAFIRGYQPPIWAKG